MLARPVITLLTDFGVRDPFVAMMKGVVAGICPLAHVVDLTHEVPPQEVRLGAFWLARSFRYFPPGTVHLAVVDPGVGTRRRPIAIEYAGHRFVGPDNGLLGLAAPRGRVARIDVARHGLPELSNTFHGRDLFAPLAARLAAGLPFEEVGAALDDRVRLTWERPRRLGRTLFGRVVCEDRFGNLITNLEPRSVPEPRRAVVEIAGAKARIATAYGAAKAGALVAVFGGYGLLEIAVRDGSASRKLRVVAGEPVRVAQP